MHTEFDMPLDFQLEVITRAEYINSMFKKENRVRNVSGNHQCGKVILKLDYMRSLGKEGLRYSSVI